MKEIVHCIYENQRREQRIDYFCFNPQLDNGVDSGQIRTVALLLVYYTMGDDHVMRYLHKINKFN